MSLRAVAVALVVISVRLLLAALAGLNVSAHYYGEATFFALCVFIFDGRAKGG